MCAYTPYTFIMVFQQNNGSGQKQQAMLNKIIFNLISIN